LVKAVACGQEVAWLARILNFGLGVQFELLYARLLPRHLGSLFAPLAVNPAQLRHRLLLVRVLRNDDARVLQYEAVVVAQVELYVLALQLLLLLCATHVRTAFTYGG
jgi:hypothetical protein